MSPKVVKGMSKNKAYELVAEQTLHLSLYIRFEIYKKRVWIDYFRFSEVHSGQ